jgi:hypothetical protein
MKADWDKLAAKWNTPDGSVLIVDADCTGSAQALCGKEGVKGYPTIKYYLAGSKKGIDYQGGRDFAALDGHVSSKLNVASCDPLTGKNCLDIEKKFIEANKDKSAAELKELFKSKETEFKAAKEAHKAAEKEWKQQDAAFKKSEKMFSMASKILKALEKNAS